MEAQATHLDGFAQHQLGARAVVDLLAQFAVEDHGLVATPGLGGVHRDVGPAEQVEPTLFARFGHGDADARGVGHLLAGDGDRLGDHVEHAIGRREDLHLALGLVDDEDELVAAEARGEVVRADAGADPVGDRHEESVTTAVAQVVVHDLESVEVDHHDGGLALRVEARLQLLNQRPAVRQSRQFVVVRVEARALLGVDATLELHEHRGDGLEGVDLGRCSSCAG